MRQMRVMLVILMALGLAAPLLSTSVLAKETSGTKTQMVQPQAQVNINTADQATLTSLPGIGPKTAKAITDHRKKNGSFSSVEELLEIKGIGEKKLEKIRPHIKV